MIGLMSDSHDHMDAIRRAVEFFNSRGVDLVLHAGDLISPFTFNEFRKLNCRFAAVFGNNDGERQGLCRIFSELTDLKDFIELEHNGKNIALYHGTYEGIVDALADSGRYDIVVRGHTHRVDIRKKGNTTVINPGETCGYLTGKKTITLLDTKKMEAEIIDLDSI